VNAYALYACIIIALVLSATALVITGHPAWAGLFAGMILWTNVRGNK